jgi:hypothetical protein
MIVRAWKFIQDTHRNPLRNFLWLYCDDQKPLEAEGFLRVPSGREVLVKDHARNSLR